MTMREQWKRRLALRGAKLKAARKRAAKAARDVVLYRRQVAEAKRMLKRYPAPAAKGRPSAIRWAISQVGTVEHPPSSNSGPKITDWNRASTGVDRIPWCQSFANAALVHGGVPQLKSAYTP